MAKYYLDENGVRVLVRYINDGLETKLEKTALDNLATKNETQGIQETVNEIENNFNDFTADVEQTYATKQTVADIEQNISTNYATKTEIQEMEQDLTGNYATKTELENAIDGIEPYDDTELKNEITAIKAKASSAYHFKGSVANETELVNIENPEVGDVYNVIDTGMNFAWTGSDWDNLGAFVDLSPYALDEDIQSIPNPELDAIIYGGKSAIVGDVSGLKSMFANDETSVKVTLSEDVEVDSALIIPEGKEVTLNLNGKTIGGDGAQTIAVYGDLTIEGGEITGKRTIVVPAGGSVTINNTGITSSDCAISAYGSDAQVVVNSGEITAQEVPVLLTEGASATINGGHLVGLDNFAIGGNGSPGKGNINVTINGGTIEGRIQSAGYIATAIYWPNSGTLTINGGEIVSEGAGIVMRGGQVNLNEGTVVTANGASGVLGKVGDSRQVVGPYAVVYDNASNYPAHDSLELNIANGVVLTGTDGDIQCLPVGGTVNIHDNR